MAAITFLFFKDEQCLECNNYYTNIIDNILNNEEMKQYIAYKYKLIGYDPSNPNKHLVNGEYVPYSIPKRYADVGVNSVPSFIIAFSNELSDYYDNQNIPLNPNKYHVYVPKSSLSNDEKQSHFVNWFYEAFKKLNSFSNNLKLQTNSSILRNNSSRMRPNLDNFTILNSNGAQVYSQPQLKNTDKGILDVTKPTLIFFKKPHCEPCETFDEDKWTLFKSDQELNQWINLKKVVMFDDGKIKKSSDAFKYEGVPKHFPYFILVTDTRNVNNDTRLNGKEELFERFDNLRTSMNLDNAKIWLRTILPKSVTQLSTMISSKLNNKPTIVFIKMTGCGPCNKFYGEGGTNWNRIINNPELKEKYNFKLVIYDGDRFQNKRDEKKYDNLARGFPFFFRVDSQQIENDEPVKPDEILQPPRDVEGFTNYLLDNYNKWYGQ
jgi:hypothetical protein